MRFLKQLLYVACLVAALLEHGVALGNRQFEAMAKLDPDRTASSFEHQFRKVKARAKELAGEVSKTDSGQPKSKTSKSAATKSAAKDTAAGNASKKRGELLTVILIAKQS